MWNVVWFWKVLPASDFFTVEVWGRSGLVTYYVLFVMELATRRVCIAGITKHPDTQWMLQMARQLTDGIDGILLDKRYIILGPVVRRARLGGLLNYYERAAV
jgi:putative transposase